MCRSGHLRDPSQDAEAVWTGTGTRTRVVTVDRAEAAGERPLAGLCDSGDELRIPQRTGRYHTHFSCTSQSGAHLDSQEAVKWDTLRQNISKTARAPSGTHCSAEAFRVWAPLGISPLRFVETCSRAHPYPVGTAVSFSGDKMTGA
jgi:hypothetical protein